MCHLTFGGGGGGGGHNHPSHIQDSKTRANSKDLDEVAHYVPPHQDLRCLQFQLLSPLVHNELMAI